jgi:hypothetical protein
VSNGHQETSFYSDGAGVRVTNARVIIRGTTYAMANISSVSLVKIPPSLGCAIMLIVVGVIATIAGFAIGGERSDTRLAVILAGLVAAVIGIVIVSVAKPTYALRITSSSGEMNVLASKDAEYIASIVRAVNEAMVHRG